MTDKERLQKREEQLKATETKVAAWLDGGKCSTQEHPEASRLDRLYMLKMLRILFPHVDVEYELINELRRIR